MLPFKVLLGSALVLTSAAVSAGVYRWVDTEGHVHYTDRAVPNSELVNVRTGHVDEKAAAAAAAGAPLTGDQLTMKKADCEQKKRQYESYKTAVKIVETDSLGRKHEFNADETKQIIDKTQKEMDETCAAAGISTSSSATP